MISRYPSASKSATCTPTTPSGLVATVCVVQELATPLFSYHVMALLPNNPATMSRSPSLSRSATYMVRTPLALVTTSCVVHDGLAAPSFSYHEMVLSVNAAATMSRSPSPSISAA